MFGEVSERRQNNFCVSDPSGLDDVYLVNIITPDAGEDRAGTARSPTAARHTTIQPTDKSGALPIPAASSAPARQRRQTAIAAFGAAALIVTVALAAIERIKTLDFTALKKGGEMQLADMIDKGHQILVALLFVGANLASAVRLMFYRRNGARYRRGMSWLAYPLVIGTGGQALDALLRHEADTAWQTLVAVLIAILVCRAQGNVACIVRVST